MAKTRTFYAEVLYIPRKNLQKRIITGKRITRYYSSTSTVPK